MLKDKVALVTGASQGIGKVIALALAENGADVIINDIAMQKEKAELVISEIKKFGVDAMFISADISKYEEVEKMINIIKEKFGKLHILVNNAGITKDRTLKNMTIEEWNAVINVNLTGIFNVTKLALQILEDNGRIISISSIAGIIGNFGQCNYAASKAGIIGFTKSLARELGKRKITVNVVAPGLIKTEMADKIPLMMLEKVLELTPLGELGNPEDVANAVLFLASDKSRYITGAVIPINGGLNF